MSLNNNHSNLCNEKYKSVFLHCISNPLKSQYAINRMVNYIGKRLDTNIDMTIDEHNLYARQGQISLFESAKFVHDYNKNHTNNKIQLKIYPSYIKYLKPSEFPIYGFVVKND